MVRRALTFGVLAFASLASTSYAASIAYLGSDTTNSGNTENKNAGWDDPTYAKPGGFDPNGDNRYGSDGYQLYLSINHGDKNIEEVATLPDWIQSVEKKANVHTWSAHIFPKMNRPGTSPLVSVPAGILNQQLAGTGKDIFVITLAQDKTFVLGVPLPDQRWASAANILRLSGAGADSGEQPIAVISPYLDSGGTNTDNTQTQWMNYAFFHVSGKAGDTFTLRASHSQTTPKAIGAAVSGLTFEAVPTAAAAE